MTDFAREKASEMFSEMIDKLNGNCQLIDEDFNVYKFMCCGKEFSFNEGNAKDNGFEFCPFCGAKIH